MKIGILGGTFNPIHIGHLILAEQVQEKLSLDKIIFVPTSLPPHKENGDIAPALERVKMLELAIQGSKKFDISDIEVKRGGRSYTVDTLKQMRKIFKKDELYFITGSDLLRYLGEWKDIWDVFAIAKFVVATRPGYPLENLPKQIIMVPINALDISAFAIREKIKEGKSIKYIVPEKVIDYIKKKGLYK
ncbi:MAG: nicotinate-nucleotide adenylyltransferase [Candidatus Omnitrophica bacterium]|nr:nicotinate-nucleotide adenylyltransferase [Candidatus Omnitrophota bacterium]MDD5237116.1 nicotinate-nucleotide adenylyltransferase [Candidatus Omnitrophota bacterium]MDD5610150.1 nicotinate-nucleotide adenylyltransferase [Candidatus Omnitrophota bacterium]